MSAAWLTGSCVDHSQRLIEITLANRNMMNYRMLLGRQGIPRDGLVDPNASFLQPKLHYKMHGP